MSASLACVTALSASVPLPSRRLLAKMSASSSARRAKPSAAAPTVTRNRFRVSMPMRKPSPGSPMIASAGMRTLSYLSRRERVRRDHVDPLGDGDLLSRHDERRQPARAFALTSAREGHVEISNAAVRNVGLLPDEHPFVAVAHRRALHVRGVGAAFRLGHGESGDRLASRDLRQPFALLLDRSEQ